MTQWLLRILGYDAAGATRITRASVHAQGLPVWLVIVLALVLGVLAWVWYRRESAVNSRRRTLLTILRLIGIGLLLVVIAQPVLRLELLGQTKRALLVLVDVSGSMAVKDVRTEPADIDRLSVVVDRSTTQPVSMSRLDLVKEALVGRRVDLIDKLAQSSEVQVVAFDRTIRSLDISSIPSLAAGSGGTALGDILRQAASEGSGRPATGVLLVSDGQSNAGADALAAAQQAGAPACRFSRGASA
ncbi:MAG: hypothetical protein QM770_11485 [Tepidisphaeraceae bacterium]